MIVTWPAKVVQLVEQSAYDPKFEVSNPATNTRRERMANKWLSCGLQQ